MLHGPGGGFYKKSPLAAGGKVDPGFQKYSEMSSFDEITLNKG